MAVTPAGAISFRYNYSINGRQETITFGRYGTGGITLSEAREQLGEAKKMIAAGKSPAKEKARDKARVKDAETFGAWAEKWLRGYQMADSTRDMRRAVYERELKPKFGNQKLAEITHEDLRTLTDTHRLQQSGTHHFRAMHCLAETIGTVKLKHPLGQVDAQNFDFHGGPPCNNG